MVEMDLSLITSKKTCFGQTKLSSPKVAEKTDSNENCDEFMEKLEKLSKKREEKFIKDFADNLNRIDYVIKPMCKRK